MEGGETCRDILGMVVLEDVEMATCEAGIQSGGDSVLSQSQPAHVLQRGRAAPISTWLWRAGGHQLALELPQGGERGPKQGSKEARTCRADRVVDRSRMAFSRPPPWQLAIALAVRLATPSGRASAELVRCRPWPGAALVPVPVPPYLPPPSEGFRYPCACCCVLGCSLDSRTCSRVCRTDVWINVDRRLPGLSVFGTRVMAGAQS